MSNDEKICKVGNISKDPVLGEGKNSGKAFTKFSIAVNTFVPKGGDRPPPTYYNVVCFGGLAEHVAQCLKKGQRVIVYGKGQVKEYTGQDGQPRTSKEILADAVGPDLLFDVCVISEPDGQVRQAAPASAPAGGWAVDEEPF